MQNVPELSKALYISHAYEHQFKKNILGLIDKKLILLIMDLHKIPAIPIASGCCGTNFIFCQLLPPRQAITCEINKENLLESLQETANSVKKTRKHSIYKNAMQLCCHLQELDKKISLYINKIDNISETDNQIKKLKNFRENYIPKLIERIMIFCDTALQTHKNKQKNDTFLLTQENTILKQKNYQLEQENKALKKTINNLERIINTQKKEILLKTQKISYLQKNNSKNKSKRSLLVKAIKKLTNEIYNLKNENKDSVLLIKELKTNLNALKEKFNREVQNQKNIPIENKKLSPNLFITDIKKQAPKNKARKIQEIKHRHSLNPAISFFPRMREIGKINNTNELTQTKNRSIT